MEIFIVICGNLLMALIATALGVYAFIEARKL